MAASTLGSDVDLFGAVLMARAKFDPKDYGIEMERDAFVDALCNHFNAKYRGQWSIDELVLHPREALDFCDEVRRNNGWYLLPEDVILRCVMNRRKAG